MKRLWLVLFGVFAVCLAAAFAIEALQTWWGVLIFLPLGVGGVMWLMTRGFDWAEDGS